MGGIEAEGAGELVAAEAGGDTHVGVVTAHVVGPEERGEGGEEDLEDAAARGFAGDDEAGAGAEFGPKGGEFDFRKLVEDEVADDDGIVGVVGKREQISLQPSTGGGPVRRAGPAVEAVEGDGALMEGAAEFAGAGAEFEDGLGGAKEERERAEKPAEVTHRAVGETQVAAVVQRGGVVGGERVEELGLQRAEHRERNVHEAERVSSVPRSLSDDLIRQSRACDQNRSAGFPATRLLGRVFHGDFGADGFEVSYERLHVGCVIVTGGDRKNRLVAAGCKGFLPGTPHVSRLREGLEQATIPAEQNAIADAARRGGPFRRGLPVTC